MKRDIAKKELIEFIWLHKGLQMSVFRGDNKIGTIKMVQTGWQYFEHRAHKSQYPIFQDRFICQNSIKRVMEN